MLPLICRAENFDLKYVPGKAEEKPFLRLGGEVGDAAHRCYARFQFAPFSSLPWLRADITNEQVSQHDDAEWGHVMKRPFKNYSGDISGRFLEIMAINASGDRAPHSAFQKLLRQIPAHQRPGGYFCASGVIDWEAPIDHPRKKGDALKGRMLPALWGNARLLCGLVDAMRVFPEDRQIAAAARRLGDFYLSVLPRFNDPRRIEEYTAGGTYAAGYVTCWFPAMEGLVELGRLTGESKYIAAAEKMAAFYVRFDQLPVDHSHGMLCSYVGLLQLYEATDDDAYLARVESRWEALLEGGYINPAGGILEKCRVKFFRDEGCSIVDWLRLNFQLARLTGKARYWEMAERTLHNHFLQNQGSKGGFGHRRMLCDKDGVFGFGQQNEESTWCCTFHGELGFSEIRKHLMSRSKGVLSSYFAMDYSAEDSVGVTTSVLRDGQQPGEIMRQRIALAGQAASIVRVRRPYWADKVSAVDPAGEPVATEDHGHWCVSKTPLNEVEFIYSGDVYVENRKCKRLTKGPADSTSFVMGYGPKLLVWERGMAPVPAWPMRLDALRLQGWRLMGPEHRQREVVFLTGSGK